MVLGAGAFKTGHQLAGVTRLGLGNSGSLALVTIFRKLPVSKQDLVLPGHLYRSVLCA